MKQEQAETRETDSNREELEKRLKAARERIDQAERRREAERQTRELERKVEQAEREVAEVHVREELERKYGDIGSEVDFVETDLGIVGVRKPERVFYERFENHGLTKDEKLNRPEAHKLLKHVVVYPDWGKFETICDSLPGTPARVLVAAMAMGRGRKAEALGK